MRPRSAATSPAGSRRGNARARCARRQVHVVEPGARAPARVRGCALRSIRCGAHVRRSQLRTGVGRRRASPARCRGRGRLHRRAGASPRGSRSACRHRHSSRRRARPRPRRRAASQALTSVPMILVLPLALSQSACSSCSTAPGILNAPQIQFVRGLARLHLDLAARGRPRRYRTASNNSGRSTGNSRKESRSSGRAAERVLGEPDRVGQADHHRLVRAGSRGSARKIASHSPSAPVLARHRRCRRRADRAAVILQDVGSSRARSRSRSCRRRPAPCARPGTR